MSKNTIEINQYKLLPANVSVWGEIYGAIQDQKDLINLLDSYLGRANWGQIEGNIDEQEDLINLLSVYVDRQTIEQAFAAYDEGIKAWVEAKGYLTQHQDISGKADISYVDSKISEVESEIPSLSGYATETYVDTKISDVESQIPSLEGYATTSYVDTKISQVESEIPSLEGLASVSYVDSKISDVESQIPSVEGYATTSYVDSKISDVESQIPSLEGYATETWVEGKGYLTQHQPIKTINSQSLIGTGDITIEGGGQKYNEVDTIEDLDDLTPNQGDIAVVATAAVNVLTENFIYNPQFLPDSTYAFKKKDFTVSGQTGVIFRIYGQLGNIWFGVMVNQAGGQNVYYKMYSTDGSQTWEPWEDDEYVINTPSQIDGAMNQGFVAEQELVQAVSFNLINTNVAYEYKDGSWGQTTNKEYVDEKDEATYHKTQQWVHGYAAQKLYVFEDPEGVFSGETGSIAYSDDNYWVKLRDSYQTTGWKSIKEFNKFFKYTTVNDRDADTYACENGNICEVLGEQQGTEDVSIMSQDLLMNPQNYFEAGKTYTFSIKDGVTPNGFVMLFHYRDDDYYYTFGPQYNWNIPSVWGRFDDDEGDYVAWDGTPFTVEIPSNADDFSRDDTQGEWDNSYQWFDITTEVPVYGPSTFYIYENGWKQLVVANDLKTINQQSIVGSGDITISGGGVGQSEGANAGEIFNSYEGTNKNIARGVNSHAEGVNTIAGKIYAGSTHGSGAHAEGCGTKALSNYSHAEGLETEADGADGAYGQHGASHAEGIRTKAIGSAAHAEGYNTLINYSSSRGYHAEGSFNVSAWNFQHTVGIGDDESARKNGHLITNTGKHYIPNVGGYIGRETDVTNVQDVATVINSKLTIPTLPSADGNYVLKCTITDGVPTYTWVSE